MPNVIEAARRFMADSLTSLTSAMGTDRDRVQSTFFTFNELSDADLANMYRGAWLPRKIVDIPAFDAAREWRQWQATNPQIEAIENEEKRLNVKAKVLEALKKARLWGGAAILIGTADERYDQPLDFERVGKGGIKYLTVLTRRNLNAGEFVRDASSEWFNKPGMYTLGDATNNMDIHPSRLVIFHGAETVDHDLNPTHRGWGDPVLTAIYDVIRQAEGTSANIASLVFEAKINVFKIPNFMDSVSDPRYRQKILDRYALAATAKGVNGDLLLDKEEEFDQKTINFATLPELLMNFMQLVSGAADIPVTRMLGQSPAGMNATGESDLRNYYDRISAMQELDIEPALYRLDETLIRSALGDRDDSIYYDWAPLWQLSEKERAEIAKIKAESAEKDRDTGLVPLEALMKGRRNQLIEDNTYPGLETAIEELGEEGLGEEVDDPVEAGAMDPEPDPKVVQLKRSTGDAAPRTLYVSRKLLNADEVVRWAKAQGFTSTLEPEDMHVTITFSRAELDWMKIGEAWQSELKVAAGGPRLMEQFSGGAVVLLFKSTELEWRHQAIKEAGASHDFPDYQPHVTISYAFEGDIEDVEPYQGELVFGPEIFAGLDEDWKSGIKET